MTRRFLTADVLSMSEREAMRSAQSEEQLVSRCFSVCVRVCACMYDCHIAVAVRPLAPFEMAMTARWQTESATESFPRGQRAPHPHTCAVKAVLG